MDNEKEFCSVCNAELDSIEVSSGICDGCYWISIDDYDYNTSHINDEDE